MIGGIALLSETISMLSSDYSLAGHESFTANRIVAERYGNGGRLLPYALVVQLPADSTVRTPRVAHELAEVFSARLARRLGSRIVSYASTKSPGFTSRDGRTTFALLYPPANLGATAGTLARARGLVRMLRVDGAPVHVTGLTALLPKDRKTGSLSLVLGCAASLGVALLILLYYLPLAYAIIPLLTALMVVPVTFLLVRLLSTVLPVSEIAQYFVAFFGLGLSIDYSLLVITSWREAQTGGRSADFQATGVKAVATAGQTVVLSGIMVAAGIGALVVIPIPFMRSVGYAGMLIVLVAVAAALTLIPILLTHTARAAAPRTRRPWRGTGGAWLTWGALLVRKRAVAAAVGLALLALLSAYASQMRAGIPLATAIGGREADTGLIDLERSGIGSGVLTPTEVFVPQKEIQVLLGRLQRTQGVRAVVAPREWETAGDALLAVLPGGDSSASSEASIERIRRAAQHAPGALVGGVPAYANDFTHAVFKGLPKLVAIVAAFTMLVLGRALKSPLLALKAVILSLLSVLAAWGLVTLVWEWGLGSSLIWGIPATRSVQAWTPLMIFSFLWGLSIDYEVIFLVRLRAAFVKSGSVEQAVTTVLTNTGPLITCSALIVCMTLVLMSFISNPQIKVLATGLAGGILVDATVVRALLAPALVLLLGRLNWWPSRDGVRGAQRH